MKKVILLLLTILSYSACTQAQIIETDSKIRTVIKEPEKPKSPRFTYFTAKIGGGVGNDGETGFRPAGNIELGIMHQLNDNGLYFGGEIGGILSNVGSDKYLGDTKTGFIFRIGPTLGLIKPIKENLEFDGHIGLGYGYCSAVGRNYYNAEIGGGVWHKKYFVGIELQGYLDFDYNYNPLCILLNLGIRL